ncbi:hypothetical protein M408DRAFT_5373 [Serendipita vermifera MAFF 305830]|uniref:Uncharacterized protein n=1 Tax=Serendipita vermifera MAFF 305830 TaxID=933852 RepID=A0A0C3BPD9_SERVB|nr:hypothetical protein M408DRAFT_5373 [Serendipita vermifera MAFF 305830]
MANEMTFPMVVDAEMGMPLDLSRYECLWQDDADPLQLNPDPDNIPPVDPKDEFMLEGFMAQPSASRSGSQAISGSQPLQVSWLRRTEYVTAKDSSSKGQPLARGSRDDDDDADVDISREAQIRDVEATFPPSYRGINMANIKHPTKPGRKAIEVFDLLPDPETFATTSDIFRFPERPGERPLHQEDPRLDSALLRPVRLDDGENFIAYYLAREDKQAIELKEQRNVSLELNVATDAMRVPYDLIRDYETKPSGSEQTNDLVILFDHGDLPAHTDAVGSSREYSQRPKGVYYKAISRRHVLKRRRVDPNEPTDYHTKTDVINLAYRAMDETESAERDNDLEELMNPNYEPPEEEEEAAPMVTDTQETTALDVDDF